MDRLQYDWFFGEGAARSSGKEAQWVYEKPGNYQVVLNVRDEAGERNRTHQQIVVGNGVPQIALKLAGNQSFFHPGQTVDYQIQVQERLPYLLCRPAEPLTKST